jgi:methylthiol:coenzyme M methyltransferase
MGAQTIGPMTSRQRVLAALRREPVDRTPVCNPTSVATVELMDLVDAPFPDANRVPELMARLAATGYTELGFDSIMPVFTIIQESSAMGCKVQWEQKDNWPTVKMREPIFQDVTDIQIPPNLLNHPDTRCVIEAIQILRKQFGNEVAIIGKTMGPWSLGYHCFGVEPFLLMSLDNPGKTKACLEKLKEVTIQFGLAQIDAGADALTLPDHATGDLVSGEYYVRYLRDLHIEFAENTLPKPAWQRFTTTPRMILWNPYASCTAGHRWWETSTTRRRSSLRDLRRFATRFSRTWTQGFNWLAPNAPSHSKRPLRT